MTPAEAPGSTAPTIVILTDDQEGSAGTVLYASPVPFLVVANPHARYSWLQSQRLHTYITLRKGEEAVRPRSRPPLAYCACDIFTIPHDRHLTLTTDRTKEGPSCVAILHLDDGSQEIS